MDGMSLGTQWSRRDTLRNRSGLHVDHNVFTREHDSVSTTNPKKLIPEVVTESTRVTGADMLEESDENNALESHINGEPRNRRIRMVGMKLAATLLFTFSQVCHEWNHSKIVQPYLDTLYASRVDVLEVGGPTNNGLIDEISKLRGPSHCVNQQRGYDLHRMGVGDRAQTKRGMVPHTLLLLGQ